MSRRMFFAFALAFAVAAPPLATRAEAQVRPPLVRVVDVVVDSLTLQGGQLIADATVTLDILGREVTRNVQFPITLGGTAGEGECDILNLSLGPIHLDLLGLVVDLDDCAGGPVTVDITAQPGGGLLGDLLCGLAGGLLDGLDLGDLLGALPPADLGELTGGLVDLLNQLFDAILAPGAGNVTTGRHLARGVCEILTLEIPEGLHLNLLGLQVDTSPICLAITAEDGPGNLLGNLLCSLTDLLNNRGNNSRAEQVLVRNILRLLDQLGL